jgi:hypothetical protein
MKHEPSLDQSFDETYSRHYRYLAAVHTATGPVRTREQVERQEHSPADHK